MERIMSDIGKTIHNQIRMIDSRALFAWGAKDMVYMSDGFKFKTSGMVKRKCWVYIRYDHGLDLYEIIYARIRKTEWIVDNTVSHVYCEDLVKTIDHYVG
jgi:hypothetical protein